MAYRSTIKEKNVLLDLVKKAVDLKSRKAAEIYLYSTIGVAFKEFGVNLSHYMNGSFTLTMDHANYYYASIDELLTPALTAEKVEIFTKDRKKLYEDLAS